MNNVRITGIGLVNRVGVTPEALWDTMTDLQKRETLPKSAVSAFSPKVSSSKLRRMNRYCKLALYGAMEAGCEAQVSEEADPFMRGTIFTTGYGSVVANLKFCREAEKGEPDFCSPTVFTGIVPNSCVGTVCMFMNCKGVSTVLAGGNHLEYSSFLLKKGRAEYILAGAVEEYSQELFDSVSRNPYAAEAEIEEGTVVFCLEPEEAPEKEECSKGYCTLKHTLSVSLGGFPVISDQWKEEGEKQIREAVSRCLTEALGSTDYADKVDGVLSAAGGTAFDETEAKVLETFFSKDKIIPNVKKITGETMGCGLSMGVAAGALCLSHGYMPGAFTGNGKDMPVEHILVTGYDTAGNYSCCLLEK